MNKPVALIEREVLKEIQEHWSATGTVASPLFDAERYRGGRLFDKVPLYLSHDVEWQLIETAPRDGTEVLCVCMQAADKTMIGTVKVDSWQDRYNGFGKFNDRYWPATHWMPLPPLPSLE